MDRCCCTREGRELCPWEQDTMYMYNLLGHMTYGQGPLQYTPLPETIRPRMGYNKKRKILYHTRRLYEPIRGAWLRWVLFMKIPNIAVAASNVLACLPGRSAICPLDFVLKTLSPAVYS
jgi:hypothetical protein